MSFEVVYGNTARKLMAAVNPIKKMIVKTYCTVHKYINIQAIRILKNEGFTEQYEFYRKHIECLNNGAFWADQDFKSSNHFYHYITGKGIYGFSNALTEFNKYYDKALKYYKVGDMRKSMCYFGAACHLVQDSTVPQHGENKFMDKHRSFELWILNKVVHKYPFSAERGIVYYKNVDEYIKNNAVISQKIHDKYNNIQPRDKRYLSISNIIIKLAQRSTAGLMLNFYDEIN